MVLFALLVMLKMCGPYLRSSVMVTPKVFHPRSLPIVHGHRDGTHSSLSQASTSCAEWSTSGGGMTFFRAVLILPACQDLAGDDVGLGYRSSLCSKWYCWQRKESEC